MKKIYVLLMLVFVGMGVRGQIAAWDFTGPGNVATFAATTFNANLVATTNITRGTTAAASAGVNSFRTVGFKNDGIAVTNTDYFQITLTAQATYTLSLSTIDARFAGTATYCASPGVSSQFAYSLDGTTFTLIGSPLINIGTPATMTQINLTGIAALQNVAAGTTVTLRYYATGQTATGGWGFNSPSAGTNGLAIGGSVTPAAGNSISTGTVSTSPFCVDAVTTAAGSVAYTSTGTYSNETFTALLSDAAGSFAAPVTVGTTVANGVSPSGSISITIPAGTPSGVGYKIRIDAIGLSLTGTTSTAFTIVNGVPDISGMGSSFTPTTVTINWTNPVGCYDDVLMVAKPLTTIAGIPTGDGTAYTADLDFLGVGSVFDGTGKVVYKGTTSPQTVINLTTGTLYYFRIFTRKGTTWSNGVEISVTPTNASAATDYFRSVASGSWASTSTWESSHDSTTWFPATLVPGATASHVVIQNTDSVYLAANTTTQNLTLKSGAIMNALTFTMTATVRFNLLNTSTFYQGGATTSAVPGVQQVLSATSNYHYNGTQAGTTLVALPEFGNLYWEPTASGNGTFTNSVTTSPFFGGLLVHGNMTINIQGGTSREIRFSTGTTVSRTHTIDGNLNIISSSSTVVLQNGSSPVVVNLNIGGNLNITAGIFQGLSTGAGTGDANVNLAGNISNTGGTIQKGAGTGVYTFNFTGNANLNLGAVDSFHHVTVATGKTVTLVTNNLTMAANKNLTLGGHIILGNNNLSMDGTITGGALASHIVTNGTGLLTRRNILTTTSAYFPVGAATGTYNPITITNNDAATINYSAKVENAINPSISVPLKGIKRTWTIKPSATPSSADVLFEYIAGEGNAGFNYAGNLELGQYTSVWNVIKTGIVPSGAYQASATNITSMGANIASPFVLGNLNAILAFGDISVNYFTGVKQNNAHQLNWKLTCNSTPSVTISLERSADGRDYRSISSITATAVRCAQPFDYTDVQPFKGINYYRLKMTDADGKFTYSNTIALINAVKGFDIMNIAPNPVTGGSFKLNITTAQAAKMNIVIHDMQGRVVYTQTASLFSGFNPVEMNVSNLAPGIYTIYAATPDERSRVIPFVKQ